MPLSTNDPKYSMQQNENTLNKTGATAIKKKKRDQLSFLVPKQCSLRTYKKSLDSAIKAKLGFP